MATEAFTNDPKIQKMTGDYQVDTKELSTILEKEDNIKNILDVLKTKESDVRSIRGLEDAVLGNLNKLANKNNISELNISEKGLLKLYMGLYRYEENIDVANEQELLDKFVLSQKVKVNQLPAGVFLSNKISVNGGIYTMHLGGAKDNLFDEGVNGYNTKIQFQKDEKGVRSLYTQTENSTYTLYDVNSKSSIIEKRIIALPSNDKNKSPLNYYTLRNDAKNPFEVALVSYTKSIPIKADNLNTGEFEKTIISERTTIGGQESFFSMVLKSNDKTTNSSSEYNTKEKDQKIYFDKEGKLIPNQTLFLKQKGKSIFMTYIPEQALDGSISFKIDEKQVRSEYKDLKKTAINYTSQVKESGDKDVYDNELRQVKEGLKDNKLEVEKKIDVNGTIPGKVLNINQDRLQIGAISGGKFVDDLTVPFSEFVTTTKDEKGNESEKKKDLIVICVDQKLYNIRKRSDTKYEISDFKDPNIDRINKMITSSFNDKYRNGLAQSIDIESNLVAVGPSEDIISQTDGSDMIQYTLKLQASDSAKSKVDIVFDNKGNLVSSKEKTDQPTQYASIILNGERLFLTLTQEKDNTKVSVDDNKKKLESMQHYVQTMVFDGLPKDISQIQKEPELKDGKYEIDGITFNKQYEPDPKIQTIDGVVYTIQGSNGKYKVEKTTEQISKEQTLEMEKSAPEKIKKAIEAGGFQQKNKIDRKNDSGQIIGFVLDVSKIDITKTPVTKKSKEKTSSVENTYKVYFDLNGNIDNTKSVYKFNTDGSPQITEQMKAEVVGEKLYITKPESLQKAKEDQQASDKRKELLQGYPKEGKVRIEKDNKIYEISTTDTKEFAYTKFNDPLAKQQGQYDKDLKYIKDTYVYKDQNLGSYEKMPFYTQLKDLRNADPESFNEHTINELIAQEKTTKEKELKPLTAEQQSQLQSKVDEFIKDSNNFKDFDLKNATEVKSDATVSALETKSEQITKPVQLDKQPTIDTAGKIINAPKIEKTSDAEDKDGKREKGKEEGSFINKITLLDANGKSTTATITVDKNKIPTVDNKDYNVVKEINEQGQEVLKLQKKVNPIDIPLKASLEQTLKVSDKEESSEKLTFRWVGYKRNDPAQIIFQQTGKEDIIIKYNKLQSQTDRSSQFMKILQTVKHYNGSNEFIKKLNNDITGKSSGDIIRTVQDWSKKLGCDCKDFNDKKFGLQDTFLGINTYASLLLILNRELKSSKEDNGGIKDLLQDIGQPDITNNNVPIPIISAVPPITDNIAVESGLSNNELILQDVITLDPLKNIKDEMNKNAINMLSIINSTKKTEDVKESYIPSLRERFADDGKIIIIESDGTKNTILKKDFSLKTIALCQNITIGDIEIIQNGVDRDYWGEKPHYDIKTLAIKKIPNIPEKK